MPLFNPLVAAGADTQVQFNDAGVFAGDAGLVYVKTTDLLTVGTVQVATAYKSVDGSTGASGAGTVISAITVKNGLVTAITVA